MTWNEMKTPIIVLLSFLLAGVAAASPPNILIVLGDDCTYNDLPAYGGKNARTPTLDRLASQSLVFNRAYLGMSMCTPCRSELYTGQYPLHNGAAWNHSRSVAGRRSMPHYLGDLGYRVGIAGKTDIRPPRVYPFESVPGYDDNCVRNPTRPHDIAGIREFISRDASQPFALVVALVEPHVPWCMGDPSAYPPESIELPPNLVDTVETRRAFAAYLAEITYMDGQVGEILDLLEELGHADDTLVLYSSEQGAQFPGCKWTTWDVGLHTGLMVRWPGVVRPGQRTDALVQYTDILPTLVEAAGGALADAPFDGFSFLSVLTSAGPSHRTFTYGMHNNLPEGSSYSVRSVCDGEYRYIRNLTPDRMFALKWIMGQADPNLPHKNYWNSWVWAAASDTNAFKWVSRYVVRPSEELYHTAADPYEQTNLAARPEAAERKQALARELDRWMKHQDDPGALLDTREVHQAAQRGHPQYGPHD